LTKHPNYLWIIVVLLGLAFDFLFWGRPVGVNFIIFSLLCLLGGFTVLLSNGLKPALKSLPLLLPVAFFEVIAIYRQEPLTLFLAYLFSFVGLGLLAVSYLGGRWMEYGLLDYMAKLFGLIGSILQGPLNFIAQVRKERAARAVQKRSVALGPVVRGLLISAPILAVFAALLASADAVFNQKLGEFFNLFNFNKISDTILHLVAILMCAYVLAGVFLHAGQKSQDEKLYGKDRPASKLSLGFTEAAVVMGSVIVLFGVFVVIQFRYFFGGVLNIGVQGLTYSQYARSGFNELVTVAFFSLLIILGLSTITRRTNKLERRLYSGLSIAMVVLVLVILDSAFQRLGLALDWHGYSRLRLYPQVFLIWIGILLVAVAVLEILHLERFFALTAVFAALGFAISLSLFNVDASIVSHNVQRATQGKYFNVTHLASLSSDAVPVLVDEFEHQALPNAIHEGIGAALTCFFTSESGANDWETDWRSYNVSRWWANQALAEVSPELKNYVVRGSGNSMSVLTPGHADYLCHEPGSD
jgi:hypothetical protein